MPSNDPIGSGGSGGSGVDGWPRPAPALTSIPARRGARVVVLVGPGVLAARAGRGLRTLAGITGATVVNTVGAKGVLRWDDPLHGGTAGLQVEDPALAEITTADLIVTSGLDPAESASLGAALDARAEADPDAVIDIDPAQLALAAAGWPPADGPGARPALYDRIAGVVGPMYEAAPSPDGAVTPPAAARALATGLTDGGLVVAPPGPTGFWLGRTFPTSVAGSVLIATGVDQGTASLVALDAARVGRPVTLVVAAHELPEPVADGSLIATVVAERLPLHVEVWTDGTEAGAGIPTGGAVRTVRVDWSALDALVAVAGEPDPAIWPGRAP